MNLNEPGTKKIVFFDGVCHLCNNFVDFLIKQDQERQLLFAPLQGETAKKLLTAELSGNLDSVVYYKEGKVLTKSDAVLEIFLELPKPWNQMVPAARMIPAFLRDQIYKYVANNRYQWFGQKESCRIPTPEERAQFLE